MVRARTQFQTIFGEDAAAERKPLTKLSLRAVAAVAARAQDDRALFIHRLVRVVAVPLARARDRAVGARAVVHSF